MQTIQNRVLTAGLVNTCKDICLQMKRYDLTNIPNKLKRIENKLGCKIGGFTQKINLDLYLIVEHLQMKVIFLFRRKLQYSP